MAAHEGIFGWILWGRRDHIAIRGVSALQVLNVVREYGVRLGQHLHLYVPDPPLANDTTTFDMLETLVATGVVAGGPYLEESDRVHDWVRDLKPHLFRHAPPLFKVYRIDEKQLIKLIETLDGRGSLRGSSLARLQSWIGNEPKSWFGNKANRSAHESHEIEAMPEERAIDFEKALKVFLGITTDSSSSELANLTTLKRERPGSAEEDSNVSLERAMSVFVGKTG